MTNLSCSLSTLRLRISIFVRAAGEYTRAIRKLRARLTFVDLFCSVGRSLGIVGCSSLMYLRTRVGSWRAMIGGARLLLRFGGTMSLRIWSLVRLDSPLLWLFWAPLLSP